MGSKKFWRKPDEVYRWKLAFMIAAILFLFVDDA
jgi:hypothetical protein